MLGLKMSFGILAHKVSVSGWVNSEKGRHKTLEWYQQGHRRPPPNLATQR